MHPIANFQFRMPRNAAQSALERLEGKIAPAALAEVHLGYQEAFHPIYHHRYCRTNGIDCGTTDRYLLCQHALHTRMIGWNVLLHPDHMER